MKPSQPHYYHYLVKYLPAVSRIHQAMIGRCSGSLSSILCPLQISVIMTMIVTADNSGNMERGIRGTTFIKL